MLADIERQRFLDDCDHAYARIKADPDASKADREELDEWEATLWDGLQAEWPVD